MKKEAIRILSKYGYSGSSVEECAEEWVSKGHVTTGGLVKYYQAYYNNAK